MLSASLCDFLFAFTGYEQYQEAGGNVVTVSVKGECASKTAVSSLGNLYFASLNYA